MSASRRSVNRGGSYRIESRLQAHGTDVPAPSGSHRETRQPVPRQYTSTSRDQLCSTPCKIAWRRHSRACAARGGCPRPTSTRPRARSGSPCSRPTSTFRSSRTSWLRSSNGPARREISGALNPTQQIIKIVNDELVDILGGETRHIRYAKRPPTVIMLAGLQGAGKTTLAGKLALWFKEQGHSPLLVAADLQRPNAVNQLQVVGQRAGVTVFAPEPGNGRGRPRRGGPGLDRRGGAPALRRGHRRHRRSAGHRRRADAAGRGHPRRPSDPTRCCSSWTR